VTGHNGARHFNLNKSLGLRFTPITFYTSDDGWLSVH